MKPAHLRLCPVFLASLCELVVEPRRGPAYGKQVEGALALRRLLGQAKGPLLLDLDTRVLASDERDEVVQAAQVLARLGAGTDFESVWQLGLSGPDGD